MVSKKVTLTNSQGFHMYMASVFAGTMGKYSCDVFIKCDGNEINGKSVMNILAAGIKAGTEIELLCAGDREKEALTEAVKMIEMQNSTD